MAYRVEIEMPRQSALQLTFGAYGVWEKMWTSIMFSGIVLRYKAGLCRASMMMVWFPLML